MKDLIQGVTDQIKLDEGLRLKLYKCSADKMTIGYGRNIEDNGITQEEAELLLRNDIRSTKNELAFKFDWFLLLPEEKQGVLINMCFNLGLTRLLKFKKMLLALESGDYYEAAAQMLDSRWANQVGKRAIRLSKIMEGHSPWDGRENS